MAKKTKKTARNKESDGAYLLKLVLYIIVGSQWVRIVTSSGREIPIPFGLIVGSAFALHEHFQIDRKIEYAVLAVACLVGFWTQMGFVINLVN